jgi:hypothetical protein
VPRKINAVNFGFATLEGAGRHKVRENIFAAPLEPLDFIPTWALTGEALSKNAEELRRNG